MISIKWFFISIADHFSFVYLLFIFVHLQISCNSDQYI